MDERTIGKNIRVLRESKGLTLTVVAKQASLTKSTLSKIETGQTSSPISTLLRIAKSLGVPLTQFFTEEKTIPPYVVTQKGKGQIVSRRSNSSQFGYSYEVLCLAKHNNYAEPFLLTMQPNDPESTFHHDGQEFAYILSGKVRTTIGNQQLILKSGDAIYFDAENAHKSKVIGKKPAKVLCVFIQEPAKTRKAKML